MRSKKCRERIIQLLPGPTGPTGPSGHIVIATVTRSLKVQLVDDVLFPIIIHGFEWEENVPAPAGWPLAGSYTFYKATVLDEAPYPLSELLNVGGTISHTDVMIQQQAAVAHYRNGVLIDIHWASSLIPDDSIDTLATQTLHDTIIGDCLYYGITPTTASVTNFNYNISSVRSIPTFKIPDDLPINLPDFSDGLGSGPYKAIVISDTVVTIELMGAGGGGGGGGRSYFLQNSGKPTLGPGGGGGGSSGTLKTASTGLALNAGDILVWNMGGGGKGGKGGSEFGSGTDGREGGTSVIKINYIIPGVFIGNNPLSGGSGGISNNGNGGSNGGGGGGGSLFDRIYRGAPGMGEGGGSDGGTEPRIGGAGAGGNPGGSSTEFDNTVGAGGGGGSSIISGGGGKGGDGGERFKNGKDGESATLLNGGGGGGSGGEARKSITGSNTTSGGDGGDGGYATISISLFTS